MKQVWQFALVGVISLIMFWFSIQMLKVSLYFSTVLLHFLGLVFLLCIICMSVLSVYSWIESKFIQKGWIKPKIKIVDTK